MKYNFTLQRWAGPYMTEEGVSLRRYSRSNPSKIRNIFTLSALLLALFACEYSPLNDPYPGSEAEDNVFYTSFNESLQTLDPARSYYAYEYQFISQIYEPPLQYHYLKRPYVLAPLTATALPEVDNFAADGTKLAETVPDEQVNYTLYTVQIKPNIYYQPHPAFAKDEQDHYYYHNLTAEDLSEQGIQTLRDFQHVGTRELTAEDYVYQIKRLAAPQVQSPIYGLMSEYIDGLKAYGEGLSQAYDKLTKTEQFPYLDLRNYPLTGVKVLDRYRYQIKIKGKYPQFSYWLAMPFFSPMPWEADRFYSQPGMASRNISLDWEPVGTGAYMITENNPNRRIILSRNPNVHLETYPSEGSKGDAAKGLLEDAGKPLPFIDKAIFSLEKESIPRWNKFLQGYYDRSVITSDNFDQAISIDTRGQPRLSKQMNSREINLQSSVEPAIFYLGFNMLNEVVGGYSELARKLRQAISIAIDYEEYISIFLNGRGVVASGPIPPGIFGYTADQSGMNPYVYKSQDNQVGRKSLIQAKLLLAQAGYPNGRDIKTGNPLILNYDVAASGAPEEKAVFDWMVKQFEKLDIALNIRATQYNRFQEKIRNGTVQIFNLGWSADYPDPENFLFLLYGPNSVFEYGGQNTTNYQNPDYDRLFNRIKNIPNSPKRLAIINQMVRNLQRDAPMIWGYYPKTFVLSHDWMGPTKPSQFALNTLKYSKLNPINRDSYQRQWNQPILWPISVAIILFILVCLGLGFHYCKKQHRQT